MPVWPCATGHRLQKGLKDTSVAQHMCSTVYAVTLKSFGQIQNAHLSSRTIF